MKYYVFDDEVYIKAEELIDFASKENNNKIEIKGRVYASPVCCKDCKYWHRDSATELNFCLVFDNGQGRQVILAREEDDFCSRGEKR